MSEIINGAIKEYDNYITLGTKVYGVVSTGFEEIPLIQGLFKKDGVLYFTIPNTEGEKFYSQTAGEVTEIEILPLIPESDYFEFQSGNFKVEKGVWDEMDISRVSNKISEKNTPVIAYMQIDGACMMGDNLLYSVSIGSAGRDLGVYLWTVNSGGTLRKFDGGRIW